MPYSLIYLKLELLLLKKSLKTFKSMKSYMFHLKYVLPSQIPQVKSSTSQDTSSITFLLTTSNLMLYLLQPTQATYEIVVILHIAHLGNGPDMSIKMPIHTRQ